MLCYSEYCLTWHHMDGERYYSVHGTFASSSVLSLSICYFQCDATRRPGADLYLSDVYQELEACDEVSTLGQTLSVKMPRRFRGNGTIHMWL